MKELQSLHEEWSQVFRPLFPAEALAFEVETSKGMVKYVNFDNAATTTAFQEVLDHVFSATASYGSVHRGSGQKSKISTDSYEQARQSISDFVRADSESYVIFTKNTTEAINHLAMLYSRVSGKVLVSDIEHSSNLLPWLKCNEVVQYKTNPDGTMNIKEIVSALQNNDIKLIAITGSSNVTGYRPEIHKIAKIAHEHGAKIFVDVCQLIQHHQVDIKQDDDPEHLDFIAFSGHKMYAPFGAGTLVGSKEFFDHSEIYQIGGGNLPYITRNLKIIRFDTVRAHDPGTPNMLGILAISKAAEILERIGYDKIAEYEQQLVSTAYKKIVEINKVILYSQNQLSVIPFDIKSFDSRLVAEILANEYGIGVRAGSFCTYELIRKLKGISDEEDKIIGDQVKSGKTKNIPGIVRASFSLLNNPEDVIRFVNAVNEISNTNSDHYLRKYSQDQITGNWTYNSKE